MMNEEFQEALACRQRVSTIEGESERHAEREVMAEAVMRAECIVPQAPNNTLRSRALFKYVHQSTQLHCIDAAIANYLLPHRMSSKHRRHFAVHEHVEHIPLRERSSA
jgi:hypothetical protein